MRCYIVFFPRLAASLRILQANLRWLTLGAQSFVVGVSP
jgi:hypothetical protein